MTICAGYVARTEMLNSQSIKETVENFWLLDKSERERCTTRIIRTKFGHHLAKYYTNTPAPPYMVQDSSDDILMILGFTRSETVPETVGRERSLLQRVVDSRARSLEQQEGQF